MKTVDGWAGGFNYRAQQHISDYPIESRRSILTQASLFASVFAIFSACTLLAGCEDERAEGGAVSVGAPRQDIDGKAGILSLYFSRGELLVCIGRSASLRKSVWAVDIESGEADALVHYESKGRATFVSSSTRELLVWRQKGRDDIHSEYFIFAEGKDSPLNFDEVVKSRAINVPFLYFSDRSIIPVHVFADRGALLYFQIDVKASNFNLSTETKIILFDFEEFNVLESTTLKGYVYAMPPTLVPVNESGTRFILPLHGASELAGDIAKNLCLFESSPLRLIDDFPLRDNVIRVQPSYENTGIDVYRYSGYDDIAVDSVVVQESSNGEAELAYGDTTLLKGVSTGTAYLVGMRLYFLPDASDSISISTAQRQGEDKPPLSSIQGDRLIENFVVNEDGSILALWLKGGNEIELWDIDEIDAIHIETFAIGDN